MAGQRPKITQIPVFASEDEERAWWDEYGRDVDPEAFPVEVLTFGVRRPRRRRAQEGDKAASA